MKNKELQDMFPFDPEAIVSHVWDQGYPTPIGNKVAKEISCPMCESKIGYTCLADPKQSNIYHYWGCLNNDCIKINTSGAKRIMNEQIRKNNYSMEK